MVEIKNSISFDTYKAVVDKVVNDVFPENFENLVYYPELYDLSRRTALLSAFAPDFNMSDCKDNNALFERVFSDEANEIIEAIPNDIYMSLTTAIENAVDFKRKSIENSPMSLSDYALSRLFNVLTEKLDKIDMSVLNGDVIKTLTETMNTSNKADFTDKLVDSLAKAGYLAKPKATKSKPITQTTRKKK